MATRWFVLKDDRELGPFTASQLKRLAAAGSLQRSAQIRREGGDRWLPAEALRGLFPPKLTPAVTHEVRQSRKWTFSRSGRRPTRDAAQPPSHPAIEPSTLPPASIAGPASGCTSEPSSPSRAIVPDRLFIGLGITATLMLGGCLLPSGYGPVTTSPIVVPLLTSIAFLVFANLFLLTLGPASISPHTLLTCFAATFVSSIVVCLIIEHVSNHFSSAMWPPAVGSFGRLMWLLRLVVHAINIRQHPDGFWQALLGHTVGTGLIEESVKLVPVLVAMSAGRIVSSRAALLAGALSGLGFGLIEGNYYAYVAYLPLEMTLSTYLTRFWMCAPLHGVWTALTAFVASQFWLTAVSRPASEEQHRWLEFLVCVGLGAILHGFFNAFAAIGWWIAQSIVILISLTALLFIAKFAWTDTGAATASDAQLGAREVLARHNLSASAISVLFLFASLVLSSLFGGQTVASPQDESRRIYQSLIELRSSILSAIAAGNVGQILGVKADLQRLDVSRALMNPGDIRDSLLQTVAFVEECERKYQFVSRRGNVGAACRWGDNGVIQSDLTKTIACMYVSNLLFQNAASLNAYAEAIGEPKPFSDMCHWRITIRRASLSARASTLGTTGSLDGEPDPCILIAWADASTDFNTYWPLLMSAAADNSRELRLSPALDGRFTLAQGQQLVVLLVDRDQTTGELVDLLVVPAQSCSGTLTAKLGSQFIMAVEYSTF